MKLCCNQLTSGSSVALSTHTHTSRWRRLVATDNTTSQQQKEVHSRTAHMLPYKSLYSHSCFHVQVYV